MNLNALFILLVSLIFLVSGQTVAREIHKWIDEDGVVHFGEKPPENVRSEQVHVDAGPRGSGRPRAKASARREAPVRRPGESPADPGSASKSGRPDDLQAEQRCEDAAQQLSVLKVGLPTYRDQNGKFHNTATWLWDPYEGERDYIDDASRKTETEKKQGEVRTLCANSGKSPADLEALGNELRQRSERCKIATVELDRALDPRFYETQQKVRDKTRLVDEHCRD